MMGAASQRKQPLLANGAGQQAADAPNRDIEHDKTNQVEPRQTAVTGK